MHGGGILSGGRPHSGAHRGVRRFQDRAGVSAHRRNPNRPFKWTVYTSEPQFIGYPHGEKVMIVPRVQKEVCRGNGTDRDMCLIDYGSSLTGTLLLQSETKPGKRYYVDLPYPPHEREYRTTWGSLVLALLTPFTVALDAVTPLLYMIAMAPACASCY